MNWLTTGDHKRVGVLFLAGGLLSVLAGCVMAALFQAPAFGDSAAVWTDSGSRFASAATTAAFVIGLPSLWIGLSMYVVPLQIGATRLALPRLAAVSLWTTAAGGVLCGAAHVMGRPFGFSVGGPPPGAVRLGSRAADARELLIGGLGLVAIGTLLASVALLATILTRRAEGVDLLHMPIFSWTALATASVWVLTTPVFIGGLTLALLDTHYGGTLFGSRGGSRVWQHTVWLFGRPEALLLAAPALGVLCEVVATAARRPLVGFPVARAAAAAAPLLALTAWTATDGALESALVPTATPAQALVLVPAGLVLLTWLATLRAGRPRFHGALPFVLAHGLLLDAAIAMAAIAALVGLEADDVTPFRNAQVTVVVLGSALMAIGAGLHHWAPKIAGRVSPLPIAGLQVLVLAGGVAVLAAPGYAIAFGADADIAPAGAAGAALIGLAVLSFFPMLVSRPEGVADPYEGLTLEWAASSPPPPHNFDELPEVRSPHPLHDAREKVGVV